MSRFRLSVCVIFVSPASDRLHLERVSLTINLPWKILYLWLLTYSKAAGFCNSVMHGELDG